MTHHKRKGPKSTRAGCLLCKPHKHQAERRRSRRRGERRWREQEEGAESRLSGASVGNFVAFSPLGALVPLLVKHVLHGGGIALGLVLAVGGLGGAKASVVSGRREPPRLDEVLGADPSSG
jgi:hypothetical protein